MPLDQSFPECLQRGDAAGHIQTRTAETEHRYRERFAGMIRTLCRQNHWLEADASDLAEDLGRRASGYMPNTLKQLHACIRQNMRDRWLEGSIEANEINRIDSLLRSHKPASPKRKGVRPLTSAARAKTAKPQQIDAIVAVLFQRPTPIRRIAAGLLEYGLEFATRPAEFLSLVRTLDGAFQVESAKYSVHNRRGLQAVRILPLNHLERYQLKELEALAELIARERGQGTTTRSLLRRCQTAIRMARRAVGGRSRRITPYTARHQAHANLAAMGMKVEEIAAMMGHASAGTAQSHYATSRSAWKDIENCIRPDVSPDVVAMVRPAHPSRGWNRIHENGTAFGMG